MSARRARAPGKGRGQSLAEFTLAIPIFLLVFLGIAEGGYFVVATTIVSNAIHEGARFGVISTTSQSALKNRVTEAAAPVVTLTSADIRICINGTSACTNSDYANRKAGDRLYVRSTYTHRPLVSYVFPAVTWPANAEAELWVEDSPS